MKILKFLVVKFSVYLNRHVFIMIRKKRQIKWRLYFKELKVNGYMEILLIFS